MTEKEALQSAYDSYWYALNVIKGRFLKGENKIATDAHYAYEYARDVIKGRFIKGEDKIATNAHDSYWYALDALEGRFIKGEDIILNSEYKDEYINSLNNLQYITFTADNNCMQIK